MWETGLLEFDSVVQVGGIGAALRKHVLCGCGGELARWWIGGVGWR